LPGGCKDRDREVNKLFDVAGTIYKKFNEDDKRHAWFKKMLDRSFERKSNYIRDKLGSQIDDLLAESSDIFDWHEGDKKSAWLTKKIEDLLR